MHVAPSRAAVVAVVLLAFCATLLTGEARVPPNGARTG